MNVISEMNLLLAPLGALLMVLADYSRNRAADPVQRGSMQVIAGSAILAILAEMVSTTRSGMPGVDMRIMVDVSCFLFFIFQFIAFAAIPLFIDYYVNRDTGRLKKLGAIMLVLFSLNMAALFLNIGRGFYYYIDGNNMYHRGSLHIIRVLAVYSVFVVALVDFVLCHRKIGAQKFVMLFFSILPAGVSGAVDLLVPGSRLLWPFFSMSLLFAYLFIVKSDYCLDDLTGLPNRRRCNEYIAELERMGRNVGYLFLMVDLDNLKWINDNLGHNEGDNALKDAAMVLRNATRRHDFIARYGGDEFLVIIRNCDSAEPFTYRAEKITAEHNGRGERPYILSLSVGAGMYSPASEVSITELLEQVDRRMYQCKNERRKSGKTNPSFHGKTEVKSTAV